MAVYEIYTIIIKKYEMSNKIEIRKHITTVNVKTRSYSLIDMLGLNDSLVKSRNKCYEQCDNEIK